MINNKLVTIVKDNQFDKGWTLFSPTSFEIERNWQFKKADLSSVVKLITFSNRVNLILSDACLPSRVISELEWSKKYIKINIIAKSKTVIDRYKNLSFDSCKVDENTSMNYIGITGKNNGYFMLGDDLCEVGDSIENLYFGSLKMNDKYSCLEKAKVLIVCNSGKHKCFDNLIALTKEYDLKIRYVIASRYFDKEAFDYAKDNKIELFVSNYVDNAVLVINKDNSVGKLSVLDGGYFIQNPIDRISNYVGDLFKNLFLKENIEVEKIPSSVYSCFNGKNEKLDIVNEIVIQKDVSVAEMSNFVIENFDKSICDKHNDYSNKAKAVKYEFTLIPPIFDSSYYESLIYDPIHKLHEEWREINKIKFDRIERDYHEFMTENSKLMVFIGYIKSINDSVTKMVNKCSYSGYHSKLNEAIKECEDYQNHLLDDCSFMFNSINSESSGTKFDKFDAEIEGYRKTIKEKEVLVFMGTDVLSNKRRIEILNKKIDDLLALKEKFEGSATTRSNKEADSFLAYCEKLINGTPSSLDDSDSIGKIVNTNESSKLVKLKSFVSNYLKQISDYLANGITCLKKMNSIDIPEDYPVFEKSDQRYIVINELSEYDATKSMCEKFSLKCLARR